MPTKRRRVSRPRKRSKKAKSAIKRFAEQKLKRQLAAEAQALLEERGSGDPALLDPAPAIKSQPVDDQEDGDLIQEQIHRIDTSESYFVKERISPVLETQTADDEADEDPVPITTEPDVDNSEYLPKIEWVDTVLYTEPTEDCLDDNPVSNEDPPIDIANYFPDEDLPDLVIERKPAEEIATGRRIVDIRHVFAQMKQLASHGQKCTNGDFQLVKERRDGMASSFVYQCFSCGRLETLYTEKAGAKADINDSMVWGAMSVGISHHHVQEMFAVLEVPTMTKAKWTKHEEHIQNIADPRNLCDARAKKSQKTPAAQKRKGESKGPAGQKKLLKKGQLEPGMSSK